jgi:hypothetical protein
MQHRKAYLLQIGIGQTIANKLGTEIYLTQSTNT